MKNLEGKGLWPNLLSQNVPERTEEKHEESQSDNRNPDRLERYCYVRPLGILSC
jgi:hypothetical protein